MTTGVSAGTTRSGNPSAARTTPSTRNDTRSSNGEESRCALARVSARVSRRPCGARASRTPSSIGTYQGFRKSSTTTPIVRVRVPARIAAARFGRYPSSAAAARTADRRASDTPGSSRMTIDTSDFETPARVATSMIVGGRDTRLLDRTWGGGATV
jgi:hypothetical protein